MCRWWNWSELGVERSFLTDGHRDVGYWADVLRASTRLWENPARRDDGLRFRRGWDGARSDLIARSWWDAARWSKVRATAFVVAFCGEPVDAVSCALELQRAHVGRRSDCASVGAHRLRCQLARDEGNLHRPHQSIRTAGGLRDLGAHGGQILLSGARPRAISDPTCWPARRVVDRSGRS